MGTTSLLLWSSCLLLTLFSPPAVVVQAEDWCPPDNHLTGCPASDKNTIVKITVKEDGNTCEPTTYPTCPTPSEVNNNVTCRDACNPMAAGSECKAYTYVKQPAGQPELCFLLKTCGGAGMEQDEPCHLGVECSGGQVCEKGCSNDEDCIVGFQQCVSEVCEEYEPCKTPDALDHDYSDPKKRHWGPCLKSDKNPDDDCNVYLPDKNCQHGTVCLLAGCGTDKDVTHTCENSQWMRRVDGNSAGVPVEPALDWVEPVCKACTPPLNIKVEPGLSLFCKNSAEPTQPIEPNSGYTIAEGPCAIYCDGLLVHHIHCDMDTKKWTGDEGYTGDFYCWNKPGS